MFLLCKDDITRKDGTFTVNHPFMITLQNRLYAFVAFPAQELAEYFKKMLKLEDEYRALDIGIIEKGNLKESRYLESWYLYVFSTRAVKVQIPEVTRAGIIIRNDCHSAFLLIWMIVPAPFIYTEKLT